MFSLLGRPELINFYHGSSTSGNITNVLLPPNTTGVISEASRKKNLNKIFFTKDKKLAEIYAGRAARSYGGKPILFRVITPINTQCLSDTPGASVFYADWSFCERI